LSRLQLARAAGLREAACVDVAKAAGAAAGGALLFAGESSGCWRGAMTRGCGG